MSVGKIAINPVLLTLEATQVSVGLFGGGADSLATIGFQPASANLRPQEQEKLDALTRALRERPGLQLVVEAPYDPVLDARALQREAVRRALAQARGRAPGSGMRRSPLPTTTRRPGANWNACSDAGR